MKARFTITMDEELYSKVKEKAEETETSVSEIIEIATMASIDKKMLLRHTGGLFKKLGRIMGENIEVKIREVVEGELVGGSKLKKQKA